MRSQPSADSACGGGLGIVEVVGHDAAAPEEDLPGLPGGHVAPLAVDDAQLEPRAGPPDGGGDGLDVVVRGGGRRRAALGQPVAGDDRRRRGARRRTRRMSSTGMSAAPVTATRRVDRS